MLRVIRIALLYSYTIYQSTLTQTINAHIKMEETNE